jgi:hypothetical protein
MARNTSDTSSTRRGFIAAIGGAALSGCAGIGERLNTPSASDADPGTPDSSPPGTTSERTGTGAEWEVDPLEHDKMVGAYYYAWYQPGQNWLDRSPSTPVLGEYNSRDEDVINQHITWAAEHGINTFIYRWGARIHGMIQRSGSTFLNRSWEIESIS